MAKIRRHREETSSSPISREPLDSFFGVGYHEILVFLGVVLVALVVPFLYSRLTTENFLTPKEFVARISLAFIASIFCIRFILEDRVRLSRTSIDLPLALLFGFAVMSLAWNYNVPSAIRDLRGTFLILFLVPLIVNSIRKQWQFDTLLWTMVFAGLATGTLGIMESYNIYFRFENGFPVFARDEILGGQIDYAATYLPLFPQLASKDYAMESIVSTFGNRNYLGTFTMFTAFLPLAFYFYYERPWMKAISLGLFGYTIMGLYVTRCRAALLGLIIGLAFMTLLLLIFDRQWRFVKRNQNFFLAVAFIGVGLFLFTVTSSKTSSFMHKIKNTFNMDRNVSNVYERVWVWYATYRSFAPSPIKWIIGSGFGSFKHFFPLQEAESFDDDNKETFTAVTFRQAHNDWLQLVSELGLIGMGLFLFLCWRFFGAIVGVLKREIRDVPDGSFSGNHVVLIALGAAMVSQMTAAVPDFPFHRIETALYAVLMLAMVPLLAETCFFRTPLPETQVKAPYETRIGFVVLAMAAGALAIHFEMRCWLADTLVRKSEALLQARQSPEMVVQAKNDLQRAMAIDPLPGDPYLKMSSILELEGKGEEAVEWAKRAWKNINFNARSTYHSVVFRLMHIYYHVLHDKEEALKWAQKGQFLTAGEARSIYYFYIGKIATEIGKLDLAEWALRRALKFPSFYSSAAANLAVVLANLQKWADAVEIAASLSRSIGDSDPTVLDVIGISASNLNQWATATTALKKAIALSPNQPIFRRDLGVTYLRMGNLEEALPMLEQAYNSPEMPEVIKTEVRGALASAAVLAYSNGMAQIQANKKEEGIRNLRLVMNSPFLPEPNRQQVVSVLKKFEALQAEAPPAAAVTPSVPVVGEMPLGSASPTSVQSPALPAEAPAPQTVPVATPADAGSVVSPTATAGADSASGLPAPAASAP